MVGFVVGTAVAPRRRVVIVLSLVLAVGATAAGVGALIRSASTASSDLGRTVVAGTAQAGSAGSRSGAGTGAGTASPGTTDSNPADPGRAADGSSNPFAALPEGPPPTTVPYAIGTRVFFHGRMTDLARFFDSALPGRTADADQRQFADVVLGAGYVWTDIVVTGSDVAETSGGGASPGTGTGAGTDTVGPGTDTVHLVGRMSADGQYTPFHVSTGGTAGPAVTTGSLVIMPGTGQAYTLSGSLYAAFTGSASIDCGSCDPTALGARVVLDQWSGVGTSRHRAGTWLWYPPDSLEQLSNGTRSVGGSGAGWVGLKGSDGCWRLAPATAPQVRGAALCSQSSPLVDADGRRAVLVRDGRLTVVDPVTGRTLSVGSLATIAQWSVPSTADPQPPQARYAVPTAWEDDDHYLVTARFDDALALLRCSATTGLCERAVWSTVRPGVDRIVTAHGPTDAS